MTPSRQEGPPAQAKSSLRARMLRRRQALPSDHRTAASRAAARRLVGLPEVTAASTVASYVATSDEMDLSPAHRLLISRGVRLLLPRVEGRELVLAPADAGLLPGFADIDEPVGPAVPLDELDVVTTPGLAFDRAGGRLGRGGGHYDRLLAVLPRRVVRVGVCFACQVVAAVPRTADDQPVDILVTEEETVRTGARDDSSPGS